MRKNRYECTKAQRQSCRYKQINPIGHNRNKMNFAKSEKKGFASSFVVKALEKARLKKTTSGGSGNQRERGKEAS